MINGNPIFRAAFIASSRSLNGSAVPGNVGTPILAANARAAVLSPICSNTSDRGPTNVIPVASHARANAAFSLRNPYPG